MGQITFKEIQPKHCVNAKIRRLHRLLNEPYQSLIKPYGLKGSMLSILFMIGKQNTNQKRIAKQLVLDESTMSRDLKKLEAIGFINRKRGEDARNIQLKITENGLELLNEIAPKWAVLHDHVSAAIGPERLTTLDSILTTLENLDYD